MLGISSVVDDGSGVWIVYKKYKYKFICVCQALDTDDVKIKGHLKNQFYILKNEFELCLATSSKFQLSVPLNSLVTPSMRIILYAKNTPRRKWIHTV